MLVKVASNKTAAVISALISQSKKLPNELYRTLTWDRGCKMSNHKEFTLATDIQVYFCDPKSPWQRGSNVNTNRLLRQYFPKGTDLNVRNRHSSKGYIATYLLQKVFMLQMNCENYEM
jgi:IS30 family transposase